MRLTELSIVAALATGCVTSGPSFKETEVLERMESYDKTPDFAVGNKTMWLEGGKVYFAQVEDLSGDSRPSACMSIAATQAKASIVKHVKEGLTQSGQINIANAEQDPSYESLLAFLASGSINSATVEEQYYDKRQVSETSGERVLKIHCAAKVSISKKELQRLLAEATGNGGNAQIRQKLLEAQQNFIDNLNTQPAH